jgi:four helix bundle protein
MEGRVIKTSMVYNFKDLEVWKRGMQLVDAVYLLTANFPKTEAYGLASQMQRAAVSIPSNIAEGNRRGHKLEYMQFLGIALGSAAELETQVLIAEKQYSHQSYESAKSLLNEVQSMLYVMIRKLKYMK